ncbi:hypothetical protein JMJ77_0000045, partial [Colletotrichum scovillei]
ELHGAKREPRHSGNIALSVPRQIDKSRSTDLLGMLCWHVDARCAMSIRRSSCRIYLRYFGCHDEFPESTNSFLIGHHTIRLNPLLTSIYCRGSIVSDPQGVDKKA